jgi:hypothetical protein
VKNSLRVLVPDAPSPLLLTWYRVCRKTVEAFMCLKKQDGASNQVPFDGATTPIRFIEGRRWLHRVSVLS